MFHIQHSHAKAIIEYYISTGNTIIGFSAFQ